MTAAEQMRAIAREEVGRFAEILADEFLDANALPVPIVHGFWQTWHRAIKRYDEKTAEVPA